MQRSTAPSASAALARTRGALSRRENWLQLIRFCLVGASGYVVNLAVYTLLLKAGDVHYLLAATGSFLVAVTSNYTWNRLWTFRGQRGHVAYQGLRFLVVSTIALAANLVILHLLVDFFERRQGARAGDRDRARDPVELRGEQALVLRTRLPALAAALAALAFAAPAGAATAPTAPVFDKDGRLVETPFVPSEGNARLTEEQAVAILFRNDKVADWLDRYPPKPATDAEYRPAADEWVVKAWSGKAGQIVLGKVDDRTGEVKEAWTGPQVAWSMARGGAGAFGGQDDQRRLALADLLRALLRRPRRPAAAALPPQPRPAGAALVLDLAPLLQRGRDLLERAARLPAAPVPARTVPLGGEARPAAAHIRARLAGVAARGCLRLPRRLPRRAQRRGPAQRDRRRFRRRRRRRADRERADALRPHAGAGGSEAVRHRRRRGRDPRADPDQRALRGLESPRRHLRAGLLRRLPARVRRVRLDRQVGRALGSPRDLAPVRRDLHPRPRARGQALRRPAPRRDARVRLGGVPVHPLRVQLEHERRDHAGLPDLGVLARVVRLGARCRGRAGGMDEVRGLAARAALAVVSERVPGAACADSRSASPGPRSPPS